MESHCEANVFLPFWLVTHTRFISRSNKSSLKFLFQTEIIVVKLTDHGKGMHEVFRRKEQDKSSQQVFQARK